MNTDSNGIETDGTFTSVWEHAIRAMYVTNNPVGAHAWFIKVMGMFDLHSVIARAVEEGYRPKDWQQMLLEWPHVSTEDEMQIAYTRDDTAGEDFCLNGSKRQTRTSLGKYLSRHYPHIPDHVRRDWAGRYSVSRFEIWDTKEGIISGIELGPESCMHSMKNNHEFRRTDNSDLVAWHAGDKTQQVNWDRHPYAVYAPEYGWAMAVRLHEGEVVGRALVNTQSMEFVRSYGGGGNDNRLETWLQDKGFSPAREWTVGLKLADVTAPCGGTLMPYIDGVCRYVVRGCGYHTISREGVEATNINGTLGEDDHMGECSRCGDDIREYDEYVHTGPDFDGDMICMYCCNNYYTRVFSPDSRRAGYGGTYYVRDTDAIEVGGHSYDTADLPDFICELHDGSYAHEDDCVLCEGEGEYHLTEECVEVENEWYLREDATVVECEDGEWRLRADCWQCVYGEERYSDDDACVEAEGKKYHPSVVAQWARDAGQRELNLGECK